MIVKLTMKLKSQMSNQDSDGKRKAKELGKEK